MDWVSFANKKMIATAIGVLLLAAAALPSYAQAPRMNGNQLPPGVGMKLPTTPEEIEAAKPNPQAPGFRIPLPTLDQMDPAQRDEFIKGSQGLHTPVGNRIPLMLSPEVEAATTQMLPALGKSALPHDLWELTILMVGREWTAQFEWWTHSTQAVMVGLPADAVEAIRVGKTPKFSNPGQEATYHYLVELLQDHKVSDETYAQLRTIIGSRQLVEMTSLAGYYTGVAMHLVAHNIPLRSDVKPPLPELAQQFPGR
jgi:4-carboxymuconolactone decarboxylase